MYAPKQIVVPIDFSDSSRAAAHRAVLFADTFGAPLHLVHAVRGPLVGTYPECNLPPESWETIHDGARQKLLEFERELGQSGTEISSELAEAEPVAAIQDAVEKHAANLIVMGTHGYSALRHVCLGSVAERTLRTVDCPTLTVTESQTEARRPIRRILHATDFSVHSKRAALLALGLAKRFGASVDIVHVLTLPIYAMGPYGVPTGTEVVSQLRAAAREMLEEAKQAFEDRQVPADAHLHEGFPSGVIEREAERLEADLIVMGTRGNTGLKHVFLGSVAERTLRVARCSVLTTKDGDPM